jgi:hypothetical protein
MRFSQQIVLQIYTRNKEFVEKSNFMPGHVFNWIKQEYQLLFSHATALVKCRFFGKMFDFLLKMLNVQADFYCIKDAVAALYKIRK